MFQFIFRLLYSYYICYIDYEFSLDGGILYLVISRS